MALASSLNLTCSASGSPSPSYSWYKDGELVLGETTSFLYISEAHPEDRGDYTCKATNDVGEDVSNAASVNVPGKYRLHFMELLIKGHISSRSFL